MKRQKKTKTLALVPRMIDEDSLRVRELVLIAKWLFGKPGLQIADYAGMLPLAAPTASTRNGTQKHGQVSRVPTPIQPRRRGQKLQHRRPAA